MWCPSPKKKKRGKTSSLKVRIPTADCYKLPPDALVPILVMIDIPPTERLALHAQDSGKGIEGMKLVTLPEGSSETAKGPWVQFWIQGRWEESHGSGGRLKTTVAIDEDALRRLQEMESFMKTTFDAMNDTNKHRKRTFRSCLQDGTDVKIAMSTEPSPTGKFFCKFASHDKPTALASYSKIGESMVGSDVLIKVFYVKIWASATQYGVTIDADQVTQLNAPQCPTAADLGASWSTQSMAMAMDADGKNAYGKASIRTPMQSLPVILKLLDCRCLIVQQGKQEGKHKIHLKLEKPEDLQILGALAAECQRSIMECPLTDGSGQSDSMLFFHADTEKVVLQIDEDTHMEGGATLDDVVGARVNVVVSSCARPYIMSEGMRGATLKAKSIGVVAGCDKLSSHDLRALSAVPYVDVTLDSVRVGDREKISSGGANRGAVEYISKCFGLPGITFSCEGMHVKFDPDYDDNGTISKICLSIPDDLLDFLCKLDDRLRMQSSDPTVPWTSFIVRPEDPSYGPHLKLKVDPNCLLCPEATEASGPGSTEPLSAAAIQKRTVLTDVGIEVRNVWYTKNQRGASMKLVRGTLRNDAIDGDRESALRIARDNLKRRGEELAVISSPKRTRTYGATPPEIIDAERND